MTTTKHHDPPAGKPPDLRDMPPPLGARARRSGSRVEDSGRRVIGPPPQPQAKENREGREALEETSIHSSLGRGHQVTKECDGTIARSQKS